MRNEGVGIVLRQTVRSIPRLLYRSLTGGVRERHARGTARTPPNWGYCELSVKPGMAHFVCTTESMGEVALFAVRFRSTATKHRVAFDLPGARMSVLSTSRGLPLAAAVFFRRFRRLRVAPCLCVCHLLGMVSFDLLAGFAGLLNDSERLMGFDDAFDVRVLVARYHNEAEAFVHDPLVISG